jgi:hypothetical protein
MAACQYLLINGSPVKAIFKMQRFFSRGLGIGCSLLNMENKKLLNEIKPWINKYIDFNRICIDTIKCRKMRAISKKRYLLLKRRTLEKYNSFKANPIEMMNVEANMIINSMLDD